MDSPLLAASYHGKPKAVRALVAAGDEVNPSSGDNDNPGMSALEPLLETVDLRLVAIDGCAAAGSLTPAHRADYGSFCHRETIDVRS